MFTESEIATILEIPEVTEAVIAAKNEFKNNQVEFLELSDHDFLSLIMMTPTVGIALANGSISLFEELALNKMARKMSKGGYFLKIDPVAHALKYLIKDYEKWEPYFFEVIKISMNNTFERKDIMEIDSNFEEESVHSFSRELFYMPYILVRYLVSFFLHDESDIVDKRSISKVEYDKIKDIGSKLELSEFHFFKSFCKTFHQK
ncbi:MAG: hypothetical protein OEW67_09165 [Cyclobacteriaceae bacterium]|nr:hypothetical protein [Cyclobacteriaceae bacterium]